MPLRRSRMTGLNLTDPAFDAFVSFAESAYPELPLNAAIREAFLAYMATDPLDAARIAARRAAWLATKLQFNAEIARMIGELTQRMASDAAITRAELQALLNDNPDAFGGHAA